MLCCLSSHPQWIYRWFEGFDWEGLEKGTLTPPIVPEVRFNHMTLKVGSRAVLVLVTIALWGR